MFSPFRSSHFVVKLECFLSRKCGPTVQPKKKSEYRRRKFLRSAPRTYVETKALIQLTPANQKLTILMAYLHKDARLSTILLLHRALPWLRSSAELTGSLSC